MLQSEFENLTGIYPDSVLFEEIEKAYADEEMESKYDFCAAYKENVDGLAEKIQRRTSEKLWKQDACYCQTIASNNEIISGLHRQLTEAQTRCAELEEQLAIKESTLTFETITNKEAVRLMIEGTGAILKRACGYVSEGFFDNGDLEKIQRFSEYREELLRLQNKLYKDE